MKNEINENKALSQTSVSGSVIFPSDLRTGNIIEYFISTDDLGWLPTVVHWQDIRLCHEQNESFNLDHRKIPITEEMLLKLGFEVIYRSNFTLRLDHKENFKFGAGWNLVNGHFHIRFIGEQFTNIKFVHQLQNLYFTITGFELQVSCLTDR